VVVERELTARSGWTRTMGVASIAQSSHGIIWKWHLLVKVRLVRFRVRWIQTMCHDKSGLEFRGCLLAVFLWNGNVRSVS